MAPRLPVPDSFETKLPRYPEKYREKAAFLQGSIRRLR
jgi:hypothetical protein